MSCWACWAMPCWASAILCGRWRLAIPCGELDKLGVWTHNDHFSYGWRLQWIIMNQSQFSQGKRSRLAQPVFRPVLALLATEDAAVLTRSAVVQRFIQCETWTAKNRGYMGRFYDFMQCWERASMGLENVPTSRTTSGLWPFLMEWDCCLFCFCIYCFFSCERSCSEPILGSTRSFHVKPIWSH